MINLSQRARDLGYYSYLDQVRLLWDPDIFLCTDVQDFLSHRSRIEIPWYKKGSFERIYVILHNARIKRIKEDKKYFVIEDPTEAFVAFWHSQDWLPSPHSYESIIEANGLSEEDVLHEIFFRYLVKSDLPHICEVIPYNIMEAVPGEPSSVMDRLKLSIPLSELILEVR